MLLAKLIGPSHSYSIHHKSLKPLNKYHMKTIQLICYLLDRVQVLLKTNPLKGKNEGTIVLNNTVVTQSLETAKLRVHSNVLSLFC